MIIMKELTKTFSGGVVAVNNISLHIANGEAVGLIGANGAGKTTLIKLICGLYLPTSGFIRVFREKPFGRKANSKHIGMVTGQVITDGYNFHFGHGSSLLQDEMTLNLNMELIKTIYRLPEEQYRKKFHELMLKLDMNNVLHYRVNQLSLGQRMKAELAGALISEPELLILDEPFIGVDIVAKEIIRNILREIICVGRTTVILTSHNVEEIERICARVLLIDEGKLIYNGSFDRLKSSHKEFNRMTLNFDGMPPDMQDFPIEKYVLDGHKLTIWYDNSIIGSKDISHYLLSKGNVSDILISKPTVEEIITKIYREDSNGNYH